MFYKFATDFSLWEHAIYIFMTLSHKIEDFEIIFFVHVCTKPKKKLYENPRLSQYIYIDFSWNSIHKCNENEWMRMSEKRMSGIWITAQKMKFFINDLFSKFDQIRSFLRIWSHLLKKSLTENFIFCAVNIVRLKLQPAEELYNCTYALGRDLYFHILQVIL